MRGRLLKILCLFGGLGIVSGCLTPISSPTTGAEGTIAASPSPHGATKEEPPAVEDLPNIEEKKSDEVEASPTWMAPTDGFIGCVASLWASANVSLNDGKPMIAEDLDVTLKVRNPETGEEDDLEDHSLTVEVKVSLPEDLFRDLGDALRGGRLRRIGEGSEAAGEETESGPTALRVLLKLASTRPGDPTLRDACAPERAYLRSKTFILKGSYRRRLVPYSGEKDFQLAPEETFTGLEKLILTAHPLLAPDRILKRRLTR